MNRLSSAELLSYKNDGYIGLNRQLFSAQKYQQLKVDVQQLIGKNFEPNESKTLTTIHMSDPKFLEWAAAPEILDQVEQIIGSNIALWAVTMFLKRAHSTKFVEWHCDSKVLQAYKCFDQLEHVSLLVAMSPSTLQQGCVSYIPGTHLHRGERAFKSTPYEGSLFGGVIYSLEESEYIDRVHEAKAVELQEGEYSFHDIHSVHASEANQSDTDRILLNFKYFPTHIKPLPQNLVSRVGQSQDCYLLRGVNLSGGELVNMQTDLNEPT